MKEDDQSQKQRFEEVEAELARSVSEAEDVPTRTQLALLQVYRDLAGLKT